MPFGTLSAIVRLIKLLSRSVAGGTLPPSLLFAGPSGVGKRLTAVALAQALNCTNTIISQALQALSADGSARRLRPCAACCADRAAGSIPMSLIVEPGDSGAIKIDQVRDIIDRAAYRPFEGRRRVVIIDEADALVAAGAERAAEDARRAAVRRRCSFW